MTTLDSESQTRPEPLSLKPTTLPHAMLPDAGAGGEWIGPPYEKWTNTPTPSTVDLTLARTASQISQTQDLTRSTSTSWLAIFQIILRIAFYLLVLIITIGLTMAACKFTNIWDPCEHLYIDSTECKVTSYMKGMIYYTECTEERSCILPGFLSNTKRQAWSLHKPNDTTTVTNPGHNSNDSVQTIPPST